MTLLNRSRAGAALALAALLIAIATMGVASRGLSNPHRAAAQPGGWQYHVGHTPDLGGNPATWIRSALQYTMSGNSLNPQDPGNWFAYWNAASDQNYPENWYQVGYGIFRPDNPYGSPQRWVFVQTTAQPGYVWCNSAYGFSISNGASGQPNAGCSGNADTFGMVLGSYYNVEIRITNDPASGPNGPIYGCNGNVRFLIGGIEIGRLADCSSLGGMNGISSAVLEPTSADGITPKGSTNLYPIAEQMSYFQATIFGANYEPNFLAKYCAYAPPTGAGTNIYSNVAARSATTSASCTGSSLAAGVAQDSDAQPQTVQPSPAPSPALSPSPIPSAQPSPSPGGAAPRRIYDRLTGNLPRLKPTGRPLSISPAAARGLPVPAVAQVPQPGSLPTPAQRPPVPSPLPSPRTP